MKNGCHLVIACGGTGGHFYPTLSVAREHCRRGGRVTLLVSGAHAAEQQRIAAEYGFEAREIEAVRRPSGILNKLLFPFRMLRCLRRASAVLKELNGDVLLGMGSFAAVPPCIVWPWRRKPLVLHEGNTIMGRTNQLFAGRARGIALSLPLKDEAQLKGAEGRITGMPLRDAILEAAAGEMSAAERSALFTEWGLQEGRRTVLVFGGSQGAAAVNRMLRESASRLGQLAGSFQFIILTGSDDNQAMIDAFAGAGIPARICRSDGEIQRCYQIADLVVCRGGASSLCELALFGKPVIVIPLPSAADNHQFFNAAALESAGGARCLEQKDASPERFAALLADFAAGTEEWTAMGARMKAFARPDATARVNDLIQDVCTAAEAGQGK
ncbi:MAG: UDP-N-acetylglucosamine--N-acetylmuramyl-(pentapeptide) pyrophosphoryl-undecaprenol N-acetylglucosamine transferase [Victivallales bacterium]|nr:UDP-N-acetylglucosamine--N-acetylmuramyl-(pentapeptide) pyrophosphoryl-undecaprenol N-acetylglucosamine transferase [Victivallales bacterium]